MPTREPENSKYHPDAIRVCVRDATRMGTQLLSDVLRRDRRFEVVDVAGGTESLASANVQVAVLFCDSAQAPDQLEAVRRLRTLRPELRVIALMDDPNPAAVLRTFRAGVHGIFCRSDSYKTLAKCVIKVHSGHVWASQAQVAVLVAAVSQPFPMTLVDAKGMALLSPREEHVVHWVAEGLTNREIADRMQLSEHTVKNYLFRIFDKLGVSSRAELVLYAASRIFASNGQFSEKTTACTRGDLEACPLCQFNLGCQRLDRDALNARADDCEDAYVNFCLAEAVSAAIRNKSAVVMRDLEKVIPADHVPKLKNQIDRHLHEILGALAIDAAKWPGDRLA